jgi:uncharacterized protein (TIGR03083 family)
MQLTPAQTQQENLETISQVYNFCDVAQIPPVTRREAYMLARNEYELLVAVIRSLEGDDWQQPTACTLWDVKSIVAHVTGALAGYASWTQFKRQYSPLSHKPYKGRFTDQVDIINAIQVDDRRAYSPEELVGELLAVGPRALTRRSQIPAPLRLIRVPGGAAFGPFSLGYLLDTIYTRDMWSHRLDICRATGHKMILTPDHDGRIIALVIRDLAQTLAHKLGWASILYDLQGGAGGIYKIGKHPSPAAKITLDVVDFNLLASGRITPEQASSVNLVELEGDIELAQMVVKNTRVLY